MAIEKQRRGGSASRWPLTTTTFAGLLDVSESLLSQDNRLGFCMAGPQFVRAWVEVGTFE
jgi:hypothetical protein